MGQSKTLEKMRASLKPGMVYRRTDLAKLSSNVDRHLALLVENGSLKKLQHGLYLCPAVTAFGEAPPNENSLLQTFLKDDHFVVYSFNSFNSLGLGTTQLYNRVVVFNRKRTGKFTLGGRTYEFYRWREAPKHLSPEFLVVSLLNHVKDLAEDRHELMSRLKNKLAGFNLRKLNYAVQHYGTYSSQLKLKSLLEN